MRAESIFNGKFLRRSPASKSGGFTIIELLMVLIIFVVILKLATPAFGGMLVKNRIAALDTRLSSDLGFARLEAMRQTTQVVICPVNPETGCGNDWSKGWRIFKDTNRNQNYDVGEPELRVINLIEGALNIEPSTEQLIVFGPAGRPLITPGSIKISGVSGSVQYLSSLDISPIGIVSRSPQIQTISK